MSHRILLIDDEDDILEFIRYNLTKAGYEVYTARNGAEGLQQAAAHRPHLILLDMMMPVMDGIDTCRALRRDPALKETMSSFYRPSAKRSNNSQDSAPGRTTTSPSRSSPNFC